MRQRLRAYCGSMDIDWRWAAVSLLLIAAGMYRMLAIAWHDPVAGYANNYDMVRLQGCFRVWPADTSIEPFASTPVAPLSSYRIDRTVKAPCHYSSELLLLAPAIGWGLLQPDRIFSLQVVGLTKAAVAGLLAAGLALTLVARRNPWAAIAHGLVFALVFADPANSLYLNTFYAEYSALLFFYLAAVLLYLLAADGKPAWVAPAFVVALLLLGCSKPQHQALPALLLVCSLPALLRQRKYRTLVIGLLAVVLVLLFHNADRAGHKSSLRLANATDTFLGAVLPQATDRDAALRWLGLPASCAAHIGKTWYTPGVAEAHPCPEVAAVGRVRLLPLLVTQPSMLYALSRQGIDQLRPWRLNYLGEVGGQQLGRLDAWSLDRHIGALSTSAVTVLFVLPGVYLAWMLAFRGRGFRGWTGFQQLSCALAGSLYLVFYSSLFGDGLFDFPKHNHLLFSIGGSFYLIAAWAMLRWTVAVWRGRTVGGGVVSARQ